MFDGPSDVDLNVALPVGEASSLNYTGSSGVTGSLTVTSQHSNIVQIGSTLPEGTSCGEREARETKPQ